MRECELNLIPADIIEHEALKERIRFWIFLGIGSLIFLFSVNILIKVVNSSISRDIATLESTSEKLSREMAAFKQLDLREKALLNMKDKVHDLSQKGPMIESFAAIDKAINDNITLTQLEAKYNYPNISIGDKGQRKVPSPPEGHGGGYFQSTPPVKTLKGETIEGDRVILQGTALTNTDLASMLTQLSMQPLFKAVTLKYSRTGGMEKERTVMFEIECRLNEVAGSR